MRPKNMVRIPPVPLSDSIAFGAWLETMALEGLYYKGLFYTYHSLQSVLFREGPPARVRYRIDPSQGSIYSDPPPGLIELYEEEGWTYVDSPGRFCHIFISRDAQAVEPYDTPQSLGQAMEPQLSARKNMLISACILFALEGFLFLYLMASRQRPMAYRLTLLTLLGLSLHFSVLNFIQLHRQKQALDQGNQTSSYSGKRPPTRIIALVVISLFYVLVDLYVTLLL